jgi:hypothetical protein
LTAGNKQGCTGESSSSERGTVEEIEIQRLAPEDWKYEIKNEVKDFNARGIIYVSGLIYFPEGEGEDDEDDDENQEDDGEVSKKRCREEFIE